MFLVFLYCKAAHICWWRSKEARTQHVPVNINVCACHCVYVHGDVNLGVLKKNKKTCWFTWVCLSCMQLCLFSVVCLVPLTAATLFFFQSLSGPAMLLILCFFFNILPVVMNHVFALIFVNNLYSLHVGQPITRLLSSTHFWEAYFYVNMCWADSWVQWLPAVPLSPVDSQSAQTRFTSSVRSVFSLNKDTNVLQSVSSKQGVVVVWLKRSNDRGLAELGVFLSCSVRNIEYRVVVMSAKKTRK